MPQPVIADTGPRPVSGDRSRQISTKELKAQVAKAEREQRQREKLLQKQARIEAKERKLSDKAARKEAQRLADQIADAAIDPGRGVVTPTAPLGSSLTPPTTEPLHDETSPPPATIDTSGDDSSPASTSSSWLSWPVIAIGGALAVVLLIFGKRRR